ncbi:hypothetical protein ACIHFE_19955 [Streptomyces sp. NPDC052396]|uniref:hypothetical protein n=1 Tax=Streptomyces sp. NPDC052396 TaxID=3365689 RepID=UPI0037D2420C
MAASYAVSYALGLLLTALRLRPRLEGRLDGRRLCRTYGKLTACAASAGALGRLAAHVCPLRGPALSLAAGGATMVVLFLLLARALRINELPGLPRLG